MDNLNNNLPVRQVIDVMKELSNNSDKPQVLELEDGYPLEKIDPRAFEMLLYCVFKEQINNGVFKGRFDNIDLMQGVGEQGRDCILTFLYKNTGLIQCKHTINIKTKVDITKVAEEVIKFLLNYLQDKSLIADEHIFTYFFATNTEFTDTAKQLLDNFSETLSQDKNQLKIWIENVIQKYKLINFTYNEVLADSIIKITENIVFKRINQTDINQFIAQYHNKIAPLFFRLRGYVDNSSVQRIVDILEKWIKPKFVSTKNETNIDIYDSLKNYLCWAYDQYSCMRTLVFRNSQIHISELYYPLTLVCTRDGREFKIEKYPHGLIADYKKVLISSTAGMGKSTIMKWMFLSAIENKFGIPVFIELKRLKSSHTVLDEIIEKVKPIHGNFDKERILELIEKGDFIFFLDGYDEITNEDKQSVTEDLQMFITKAYNNNFILTSRPETALGSFNFFQQFKVRDLKPKEAYQILKLYDRDSKKSDELIEKLKSESFRNIKEFLKNPLLVCLLYMAYEFKPKIPYKKHLFYAQVYDALFEKHDLMKESYDRPKNSNLDISDFEKVLRYVGYSTAKKGQVEFDKDTLLGFIRKAKVETGFSFKENDFLKDLVTTVPLFVEEGRLYSWAHKSLQDYFAAKFIEVDAGDKKESILRKIYELDDISRFYNILDTFYDLDYKTFRHTILYWLINDVINYFNDDSKKLKGLPSNLIVKRKERTFGRKFVIKIYNKEESSYIKSIGKSKLEYFREDFLLHGPQSWSDNFGIYHNQNYEEILTLFYMFDQNKMVLLRLLCEKSSEFVIQNRFLTLDNRHTLPKNEFIEINLDEHSPVNKINNFYFVNELLKVGYSINFEAFKNEKQIIELELKRQEDDDLLDF